MSVLSPDGGDEQQNRMDYSHDSSQLDGIKMEGEDYGFLAALSDIEEEYGTMDYCVQEDVPPSLGGRQYFGGLAVAPLTTLTRTLSNSPLSEEDVMKLRSIMRFSIEYHNALVVHSQNLAALNPVKQFTLTASECFGVVYNIIVAISANDLDASLVAQLCDDFQQAQTRLDALEAMAKEQVECATLKQSIKAVQGQMKDFVVLMHDSILPNL